MTAAAALGVKVVRPGHWLGGALEPPPLLEDIDEVDEPSPVTQAFPQLLQKRPLHAVRVAVSAPSTEDHKFC